MRCLDKIYYQLLFLVAPAANRLSSEKKIKRTHFRKINQQNANQNIKISLSLRTLANKTNLLEPNDWYIVVHESIKMNEDRLTPRQKNFRFLANILIQRKQLLAPTLYSILRLCQPEN